MNYYYIEFMIKEQQRLELEECERRRLLRKARELNSGSAERSKASVLKDIYVRARTILMRVKFDSETTVLKYTHLETVRKK